MLVYRDGHQEVDSDGARRELARIMAAMNGSSDGALEALLRAAELECALADLGSEQEISAAGLTSALARYWLSIGDDTPRAPDPRRALALELPSLVALRRPEGYAYYGLDPLSYVKLARGLELGGRRALVIGIRSIGTSLSAVVCAALAGRGVAAERITVRPTGHVWARELEFAPEQRRRVLEHAAAGAQFVIVDEGPGLSGSTLLAVAEALVAAGVLEDRITVLCSRAFEAGHLLAERAGARWRFRTLVAESLAPPEGARDLSAGSWRSAVYGSPDEWPGSWTMRERIKFRLEGRREIVKFEGYPPYDAGPRRRAELLAEAGYGPRARPAEPGFLEHTWCAGRPACPADASDAVLRRLASYLAFRRRELACSPASASELERMTAVNVAETLGSELPAGFELPIEAAVIADARMQPHEFVVAEGAPLLKVDGIDHGDDHLFPGPTDIAWDLAGAGVEWRLDAHGIESLLRYYELETGDDVGPRLRGYVVAYCVFQLGCVSFALRGADAAEQRRLEAARAGYERALLAGLGFAEWWRP